MLAFHGLVNISNHPILQCSAESSNAGAISIDMVSIEMPPSLWTVLFGIVPCLLNYCYRNISSEWLIALLAG